MLHRPIFVFPRGRPNGKINGKVDRLIKGWVHHLRKTAHQGHAARSSCHLCEAEIQPGLDSFKAHARTDVSNHPTLADDADIEEALKNVSIHIPVSQRQEHNSLRYLKSWKVSMKESPRISRNLGVCLAKSMSILHGTLQSEAKVPHEQCNTVLYIENLDSDPMP